MTRVELERAPRLGSLYGRAVLGLLPGRGVRGRLPVPGEPGRRRDGRAAPAAAPPDAAAGEVELVLRRATADRARLAEYARVCGFRLTDTLPATYPQVLAFPLTLRLMTMRGFPFPAAGLVHIANRIEQRRRLDAAEPLELAVRARGLRAHPRGRCVDVVTVASVDGTLVWESVATYLRRSAASGRAGGGGSPRREPTEPPEPTARWRVEPAVASAYAAVSGDRNPVHTSRLGARAFGFRRRIAHGMWTKARCLAQLASRLPEAYAVEVTFHAPVELPATVAFSVSPDLEFAVHSARSGRPHLLGRVTPAKVTHQ